MKKLKRFLLVMALVFAVCLGGAITAETKTEKFDESIFSQDPAYSYHPYKVAGEIVVDFKDKTPMQEIEKLEKDLGVDLNFVSKHSENEKLMRGSVGLGSTDAVLARLRKDPSVEYAEPDYYFHLFAAKPNDPMYKYQWNFEKINLRGAWDMSRGDNVIVAVIDTGVAYKDQGDAFHRVEDLDRTRFVQGYDFVNKHKNPLDDHAHGTHVAGTIAQSTNNHKGVAGIAYNVKIMPLKVLSSRGFGRVSDIADAVRYAADNDAKVINMSLGGPFPSLVLKSACDYAWKKGVVVVCAAGNSRSRMPSFPAGFKSCLSVSATRYDDKLAPYSNRGKSIDIAAPGGDTTVDQNGDGKPDGVMQNTIQVRNPSKEGYYIFQGTSMACPHVAGVAALVAAAGVTDNQEIVDILKKSARKKDLPLEEGYGAGILDARAALLMATMNRGWIKLVIAIVILVALIIILGVALFKRIGPSPQFYIAMIIGACGLFFLPALFKGSFPGMSLLMRGFTDWDDVLLKNGAAANPLFFSVLIPFLVAVLCYKTKFQKMSAGFAIGVAAALLHFTLFSSADVQWIPGTFVLDKLWLVSNFIGTIILAVVLLTSGKNDAETAKEVQN